MRAYLRALLQLSGLLLMIFALSSWLGLEAQLGDPRRWLGDLGPRAGFVSVLLLWSDVLLPIPSSLCMIANGMLFGLWGGAALSLVGGIGATLIAHYLGKYYQNYMKKGLSEQQEAESQIFLTKWGPFAIILTRPVPILSESVAILSGSLPISPALISSYAAIGHCVPCVLYAQIGEALLSS